MTSGKSPSLLVGAVLVLTLVRSGFAWTPPPTYDAGTAPPTATVWASTNQTNWLSGTIAVGQGQTVYFRGTAVGGGLLPDNDWDTVNGVNTDQGDDTLKAQWNFSDPSSWGSLVGINSVVSHAFSAIGVYSVLMRTDDAPGTVYNDAVVSAGSITVHVVPALPEVEVRGNGAVIADGDATPSLADYTGFGSVLVSSGTVTRTYTIYNTGYANLTVGSVTVSGAHAADFAVVLQPMGPVVPGSSTTFQVRFDPSAAGVRSAAVSFPNNDADENPYNFSIQGTGLAPEVEVRGNGAVIADGDTTPTTADHTDFGSVDVSGTTLTRAYTTNNLGTAALIVGSVTLSGTHAADFAVIAQPASPVAPGGSTTFQVRFDPSALGPRSAAVSFSNDDPDENPYNFSIQGTGIGPEVQVKYDGVEIPDGDATPSAAEGTDFGSVVVDGGTADRTYTINNLGTTNLTLGNVSVGPGFSVTAQPTSPVAPSGSTTFTVRFDPSQAGGWNSSVSFSTNDLDENPYNLAVTGTGTVALVVTMDRPDEAEASIPFRRRGGSNDLCPIVVTGSVRSPDISHQTVKLWYQPAGGAAVQGPSITVTPDPQDETGTIGTFSYQWADHPLRRGEGSLRRQYDLWVHAECGGQSDDSDKRQVQIFEMTRPDALAAVTSPYGTREWSGVKCTPADPCVGSDFHTGVDWGSPDRTPVVATENGTTSLAGEVTAEPVYPIFCYRDGISVTYEPESTNYRYGYQVWLDHGAVHRSVDGSSYIDVSVTSVYCHLHPDGRSAQSVSQGSPVGFADTTGSNHVEWVNPPHCAPPTPNPRWESSSTGAHLHLEVWEGGEPVDPLGLWVE